MPITAIIDGVGRKTLFSGNATSIPGSTGLRYIRRFPVFPLCRDVLRHRLSDLAMAHGRRVRRVSCHVDHRHQQLDPTFLKLSTTETFAQWTISGG